MKIAIWHNLPNGGGKRALYHFVDGLAQRGHMLQSWCPSTADQSYLPLKDLIPEHVLPITWTEPRVHGLFGWARSLYRPMIANLAAMDEHCRRCAAEINDGAFDILLANPCTFFRVTAIGRYVSPPSLLYLQEPYRELYEASPRLPWLALPPSSKRTWTPRSLKRYLADLVRIQALRLQARAECDNASAFDRILVNSYFSRESVLRAYGVEARVSYLGVATDLFRPLGLSRDRMVIGLGAIHPSKGVDTAIRAIGTIAEEKRPLLVWIGNFSVAHYARELQGLAEALGVKFVPYVDVSDEELVTLLNRAMVMVYTSRLEPFGLAPLEANACGTPVVAIAEGGVRETIKDGVNGILVPHRDPELLGEALTKILDDPQRARQLGESAREHVTRVWSWATAVNRLEATLMELIRSRTSRRVGQNSG